MPSIDRWCKGAWLLAGLRSMLVLLATLEPFMKPIHALAASLLATASCQAQDHPWYATVMLGAASQPSQTLTLTGSSASVDGSARYGPGLFSGGAVGRELGRGWRVEAEFSYQSTEFDRAPFALGAGPAGKGNHAATAVGLNVLKSWDLGGRPTVRSYLGVGLVRLTEVDVDFETAGQPEQSFSGSGSGWQLLAGARYDLGGRWFVDAGVRWLQTPRVRMAAEAGAVGRIDARFRPWALTAGLGVRF
jgi:opacity protein-like surface antigen